jgi:hypothetical protein
VTTALSASSHTIYSLCGRVPPSQGFWVKKVSLLSETQRKLLILLRAKTALFHFKASYLLDPRAKHPSESVKRNTSSPLIDIGGAFPCLKVGLQAQQECLKMFPWTCSTVPQKDNQIHSCAPKLESDVAFFSSILLKREQRVGQKRPSLIDFRYT